jgi:DNA-directed RNA polymerase subunit RPC12/RpoP
MTSFKAKGRGLDRQFAHYRFCIVCGEKISDTPREEDTLYVCQACSDDINEINNKPMSIVKKYPILGSSVNPEALSLTIKSLGIALIPVILAVLRMAGNESIVENDLVQVINAVATITAMIGVVYGVSRKLRK